MTRLERSVATLRVFGDDLLPSEVTGLLGAEPTDSSTKGQVFASASASGTRIARSGSWRLCAIDREPEGVDEQVAELLAQLTQDLSVWRELSRRYALDLFCGWFLGSGNEGLEIRPQTLAALSERGIKLSVDIYAPDADA